MDEDLETVICMVLVFATWIVMGYVALHFVIKYW
jgi:hypothetical protein